MDPLTRSQNLLEILKKRPQDEAMKARIARVMGDMTKLKPELAPKPKKKTKKVVVETHEVEVEE